MVFGLAVVIGAVAGVLAAEAAEKASGFNLTEMLQQLAVLVLWPTVLLVAAIAYLIMGVRCTLAQTARPNQLAEATRALRSRSGTLGGAASSTPSAGNAPSPTTVVQAASATTQPVGTRRSSNPITTTTIAATAHKPLAQSESMRNATAFVGGSVLTGLLDSITTS